MSKSNAVSAEESNEQISVLLVDDDEMWAESTARLLGEQRTKFAVTTETTLAAASTAFHEEEPDCVVSDYYLGDETGLELLSTVRERAPDRPFILITGQGTESVASDAISKEVTDYIPKRLLNRGDELLARRIETTVTSWRRERALSRERQSKEAMLEILTATPSSRNEIAAEFCDHLVTERAYACAWIGTLGEGSGVVPLAVAGDSYVDAVIEPGTDPQSGTEPALVALEERSPQFRTVLDTAGASADWQRVAVDRGFGSVGALPIEHEDALVGVLAVYRQEPEMNREEQELLESYAETIGYALTTTGWKESLLSPAPVAVELEFTADRAPLVALGEALPQETRIRVRSTVQRSETLLYDVAAEGMSAEQFRECASAVERVESVTVTAGGAPLHGELIAARPTPLGVLAEHGGRIIEARVSGDMLSVTAVGPDDGTVQTIVDAVQESYPAVTVRSFRSSGPTKNGGGDGPSLTEKQQQALEIAYYNGYFERPREHDKQEIAEKLGVSRQTFTQHLRAAERKLLAGRLDEGER